MAFWYNDGNRLRQYASQNYLFRSLIPMVSNKGTFCRWKTSGWLADYYLLKSERRQAFGELLTLFTAGGIYFCFVVPSLLETAG